MAEIREGELGILNHERKSRNATALLLILLIATGSSIGVLSIESKLLLIFPLVLVFLIGAISPEMSLYFIFALILFGFDHIPGLVMQGLVLGVGIILLVFSLILRAGARKRLVRIATPLDMFMVFWILVVAISVGAGILRQNQMRYIVGDLLQFLELPVFFFLASIIFRTKEQINKLFICFIGFAFISGLISLVGYLWSNPITVAIEVGGVRERLLTNVVAFTPFLLVLIIAQLFFLKYSSPRGKLLFSGLLFLTLLFLIILFFSFTRGYWLGFFVALIFILIMTKASFRYRVLKIMFILFLSFLGSLFLGQFFFKGNIFDLFSIVFKRVVAFKDPTSYVYYRYYEMLTALRASIKNPLWGIGLGGEYFAPSEIVRDKWVWTHYTHNNYVQILLRTGFLGMASFLAIWIVFFYHGLRIYGRLNDPKLKALTLGFLATFISASVTSLTSPLLTHYAIAPWLGIIMGLVFIIDKLESKPRLSPTR